MSMHPDNRPSLSLAAVRPSRQTLFIANSFFLIVLAFVSGYNFKGYTIRRDMEASMAESARYLERIRANYEEANAILSDLDRTYRTRFETRIDPALIPPPSAPVMAMPQAAVPADSPAPGLPAAAGADQAEKKPDVLAVSPPAAPAAPPAVIPQQPDPSQPHVHVRHMVMHGDMLSALVPKREMPFFLYENPTITDPDRIFPGQTILLRVPEVHVRRGTYMNRYFIRPAEGASGKKDLRLVRHLTIPEHTGVLGFLIRENPQTVRPDTVPFIDLSRTAPVLMDRRLGGNRGAANILSRARRIGADHGPMLFITDTIPHTALKKTYRGIRESGWTEPAAHDRAILEILSAYYEAQTNRPPDREPIHFFIFGDTVVQAACLVPEHFEDRPDKPRIRIAVAYAGVRTPRALSTLQQALGICRVQPGEMTLVRSGTLSGFLPKARESQKKVKQGPGSTDKP
ncbi:hypothetical protein JCM14469_12840 [Desulfatiferula olefinivorans]